MNPQKKRHSANSAPPPHEVTDDTQFDPAKQVLWSRPGYLIRRLNQIHYALYFEECKGFDITPVQYGVLTTLSLQPWLDQTGLALALGLDRTTTADVLTRLEEKALVERRVNPQDKRSRQARTTDEGHRIMGLLQGSMARSQERLLEPLSKEDQATFKRLLSKLVDANNQYGRTRLKAI